MAKENKENAGSPPLPLSAEELKGKQSVRATFKLPGQVIDLLGIVAAQLGLKQKSLFDQLLDDEKSLVRIAAEPDIYGADRKDSRQKTFVISKRSLQLLDKVAGDKHIPRDVLVEYSIRRLAPIMSAEQEKHDRRKLLYTDLKKYLARGEHILAKAQKLLGRDDEFTRRLNGLVDLCDKNVAELREIVEKGKRLDTF